MNPTMIKKMYDIVKENRTLSKSLKRPAVKKKKLLNCCQMQEGSSKVNAMVPSQRKRREQICFVAEYSHDFEVLHLHGVPED
jgi:5-keto 4-deoxyuronate isomerase